MGKRVRLVDMLNVWRHFPVPSFEDAVLTMCDTTPDRLPPARYKRLLAAWETLPLLVLVWLTHWNPKTGVSWPGTINVCQRYHLGHDRVSDALDMARQTGLMRRERGPRTREPYSFPLLEAIARAQQPANDADTGAQTAPRRERAPVSPEDFATGADWLRRLKEHLGVDSIGAMIAENPGPETQRRIEQAVLEISTEDEPRDETATPPAAQSEDEQWPT